MPGEFFFLTFGGLGISLAGFAGLIFALDRHRDLGNPIAVWRIRNIATTGLSIAQTGLLVFPLIFLTDSVEWTVRLTSSVGLFFIVMSFASSLKRSPAWPDEKRRRLNQWLAGAVTLGWAVSIYFASVGFLMLLFVIWLSGGIGTFMNGILELRVEDPIHSAPDPETSSQP